MPLTMPPSQVFEDAQQTALLGNSEGAAFAMERHRMGLRDHERAGHLRCLP